MGDTHGERKGRVSGRMGGPCRMVEDGARPFARRAAPACTDNFQIMPFMHEGREWQSCEQMYQAYKFNDPALREKIRQTTPYATESTSMYGQRIWRIGQSGELRSDWDVVKVDIMLAANRSKYHQHPDLRQQLDSTGDVQLVGGPSTSWRTARGTNAEKWSTWNGRIQQLIREELRSPPLQNSQKLSELSHHFDVYRNEMTSLQPRPKLTTPAAPTAPPPPAAAPPPPSARSPKALLVSEHPASTPSPQP